MILRRKIQAGAGAERGCPSLTLTNILGGVSATAAETDLASFTMKSNTLYRNGMGLRISVGGTTAANANNKRVQIYFGGTVVWDSGTAAANAKPWSAAVHIFRTGVATQVAIASGNFNALAVAAVRTALTKDDTAAIIIKSTGTAATGAGDAAQDYFTVELLPTAP